ncbi:MAG: threonine/serine exporter family protein [Clostridia bacterium]|nr:threonine/serine exporter family protein [Clostridia bacterium]
MENIITNLNESVSAPDSYADRLLCIALNIGEGMLRSGGEISRVENTVERICLAYGAEFIEVFSITSVIIAAVRMKNGEYSSQVRRVKATSNDLLRLELYNGISRKICNETPPLSSVKELIEEAKRKRLYPSWVRLIAAAFTAGLFTVSFGGNLIDGAVASFIGAIIFNIDRNLGLNFNKMAKIAFNSFIGGFLACFSVFIGIGHNAAAIIIGTVILLIPGLMFGTALRNLLCGDLLSGSLEIVRACLTALMIALGYLSSTLIFKGAYTPLENQTHELIRFLLVALGVIGFAIIFNIKPSRLFYVSVGGVGTYTIFSLLLSSMLPLFACALVASAFSALYSELCARILRAPSIVFLLPCTIPIVPGRSLYSAMSNLLSGNNSLSLEFLYNAASVGVGIACGIIFVSILFSIASSARAYFFNSLKK